MSSTSAYPEPYSSGGCPLKVAFRLPTQGGPAHQPSCMAPKLYSIGSRCMWLVRIKAITTENAETLCALRNTPLSVVARLLAFLPYLFVLIRQAAHRAPSSMAYYCEHLKSFGCVALVLILLPCYGYCFVESPQHHNLP